MPLDQRQRAFADRAEADHHDGPADSGVHGPMGHDSSAFEIWRVISARGRVNGRDAVPRSAAASTVISAQCSGGRAASAAAAARERAARAARSGPARAVAGRADQAARAVERAGRQVRGRAGGAARRGRAAQRAGLLGREAEAAVVRRIADQQHGAMAEPRGLARAHGASAPRRCRACGSPDRRRAGRAAGQGRRPGRDVPQPHACRRGGRARSRDERQSVGRQAALAQPLAMTWRSGRAQGRDRAALRAPRYRSRRSLRIVTIASSFPRLARERRQFEARMGKREPALATAPGDVRCAIRSSAAGSR